MMTVNTIKKTNIFKGWFESLKDETTKDRIDARIKRAENGNFGDVKSVGGGIYEMRFKKLVYRLYYFESGKQLYWLLAGGDKSTQNADIELAKAVKLKMKRGESC
jgi:putative addiction module killer protein